MATLQTKIPFAARKKFIASPSVKKVDYEKENCHYNKLLKSPIKSPGKLQKSDSDRSYVLRVNSPVKRSFNNADVTNVSPDEVSPAKRDRLTPTPSSLLRRLTVNSPVSKTGSATRKELFPSGEKGGDDSKKINLKTAVRALHSSVPTTLPCRDDKLSVLREFLEKHIDNETPGSLYISGPPGTGKTASLNLLLSDKKIFSKFKVITVNCTSIKTPMSLYNRIVEELKLKVLSRSEKAYLSAIEKYITTSGKMVLLVLDELDQLESRKQSLLYTVFEWPSLKKSHLVLIGIANALDLTDRVLPRLQARVQLKPQLLHFPPYTRTQIIEIITNRLTEAGVDRVFPSSALQLLSSKVAAVSGDVRRALDMARRVIEISRNQSEDSEFMLSSNCNENEKEITVTIKQVMDVVSNVYGTTQTLNCNENSENSETLPLQQKLLICSILLQLKIGKLKDITVGKLHEVYCKVCEKRNLAAVDISEFISLTNLVEARGILRLQGKVKNRLSKISLQWDEKEMVSTLQDKKLLAAILDDKSFVR